MTFYNQKGLDKICPTCKTSKLIGKSTQRYCSVECKNEHHRLVRLMIKPYNIKNKRLRRNLVVLLGIMGRKTESLVLSEDVLFEFGFDFRAVSGAKMRNKKKFQVIFCFEFRRIGAGKVLIFRRDKAVPLFDSFMSRWQIDFPEDLSVFEVWMKGGILVHFQRITYFIDNWLTVKYRSSNGLRITPPT